MGHRSAGWTALCALVLSVAGCSGGGSSGGGGESLAGSTLNPILFCTQVPIPADFVTIASTFGNHLAAMRSCARGGDLWIRYPSGTLKNLTAAAGYGDVGVQGANAIAVREPCVHWSGNKAVFSMVVGAPGQFQPDMYKWQLYEISGLALSDTPVITRVPFQPGDYNNVSPVYASDDRILFSSDRPRDGQAHLYPQLDEYEEAPSITGMYSLDPSSGTLNLLNHTPSGVFSPSVDSFGRVIFSRWDHLVRDQQADDDNVCQCSQFGTFNYDSEAADAVSTGNNHEVFPEPRPEWIGFIDTHPGYTGDLEGWKSYLVGSETNHFFPWEMNQNGTVEETLNHVGRHEMHFYLPPSRNDDPLIQSQLHFNPPTQNQHAITNILQLREDPLNPGTYFGINAPEFFTHGAGQVIRLYGPPGTSADQMTLDYITHPETANFDPTPSSNNTGHYRNILPLSDGQWIVSHADQTDQAGNLGTYTHPIPNHRFRLKTMVSIGQYWRSGAVLTSGIVKQVQYFDPDQLITYEGALWELWPCEVVARSVPPAATFTVAPPEMQALNDENVDINVLRNFLRTNDLALLVSRNVTKRDQHDVQQPYNLHVTGSSTQTDVGTGTVYDISHLQFFQADAIRGVHMGGADPIAGRRVLAQPLHDVAVPNPPLSGAPAGSVQIAADGSMAALVPARRALSWQLTDPTGEAVVRERYWLTFQPGEIRTCVACHGLSTGDQNGNPPPTNEPLALRQMLQYLRSSGAIP